jgi:hypothetical protein
VNPLVNFTMFPPGASAAGGRHHRDDPGPG